MLKLRKYPPRGFTLIELLVVVLIIGILAAIAIPQYQVAVGKARFSELKTIVKNIVESSTRYYLVNDAYPHKYQDLDLDFNVTADEPGPVGGSFSFEINNKIACSVWGTNWNKAACYTLDNVGESVMGYYVDKDTGKPVVCFAAGKEDKSTIQHKICQKETDKTAEQGRCYDDSGGYCFYSYP